MSDGPTSAAEAERQTEKLRHDLGATIDQLKDNLRPSSLAHEAYATTRAHTPDWLVQYWSFAQSPAGLALIGVATASVLGAVVTRRRLRR